ncbi:lipoprotein NlpI [Salinimonas chungwhensis]|uniref:lipoprotein NlpI n=1 Tax=Salinimonas chungwhensis TaxID=265425 RepID=UPI00036150E4|nr:lipoprotein NlpI [Salinimonas chungwhensis]
MHKLISLILFSFLLTMLTGCSQTPVTESRGQQMGNLLLAEPVPVSPRSQMAIIRYNQILASADLSDEERAELTYQRGMLYDSVGLGGLAQFDYSQALQLKPDMAEAYNSMGIHFIQQGEYIQAYEAFDSTLDINPDYDFAFLNRGIALYYGDRSDLAIPDLRTFYNNDPSDPFRALWLYFAMAAVNEVDAQAYLADIRSNISQNHWALSLVDLYLGNVGEDHLLGQLIDGVSNQRELTERLCEAYFYLGKYHSSQQNQGIAANYFKLALSTNVYDYVEHRYARKELKRLRQPDSDSP